ncbi:hypothetical protein ABID56_000918 [Alkalibacillus flavidus]|uniref:Uncharacterized protein n=1 Tax=Alkalibacillus flavidus TaxID=546021 RepID=A0ABV2KTB4_9BACI
METFLFSNWFLIVWIAFFILLFVIYVKKS